MDPTATAVRGAVRVLAATVAARHLFGEDELRRPNPGRWHDLRRALELRQEAPRQQGRFRKDPAAYLAKPEGLLLQPSLPSENKSR
jgi:hypothetical protein